jgi:hypothetical protein
MIITIRVQRPQQNWERGLGMSSKLPGRNTRAPDASPGRQDPSYKSRTQAIGVFKSTDICLTGDKPKRMNPKARHIFRHPAGNVPNVTVAGCSEGRRRCGSGLFLFLLFLFILSLLCWKHIVSTNIPVALGQSMTLSLG